MASARASDGATTTVALERERAFAWLVDPRNAAAWFASVRLERAPAPTPHVGDSWRFLMTRQYDRPILMRLAEYTPSERFAWATQYPGWRSNLHWVFTLSDVEREGSSGAPATQLALRIEQRPGLLGWPLLALATLLQRFNPNSQGTARARAQRAVDRARVALESAPSTAFIAYGFSATRAGRGRRGANREGG
jgi:hypothetical protein